MTQPLAALDQLRDEILTWRENAMKSKMSAPMLDKYRIAGKIEGYENVLSEIDNMINNFEDIERERAADEE